MSFAYPLIISNLFEFFAEFVAGSPGTLEVLQKSKGEILGLVVVFQTVLLLLTFLISIFLSHRIAGPLYKMSRAFEAVAKGDLKDDLQFRSKDHFKDLADEYNIMIRGVRHTLEKRSDSILAAIGKLEKANAKADPALRPEIEATLAVLREARD